MGDFFLSILEFLIYLFVLMRYNWRIPWNALTNTVHWMSISKWSTVSTFYWYLTKEYFRENIQPNRFEFLTASWRKTDSIQSMARRFRRKYIVLCHSFCLTPEMIRNVLVSLKWNRFDELSGICVFRSRCRNIWNMASNVFFLDPHTFYYK